MRPLRCIAASACVSAATAARSDDEAHMVFRCAALSVQWREHASLFLPWPESLGDFMGRDPIQLASFGLCLLQ